MEYWVDGPYWQQLEFVGDWGYLLDNSEGTMLLRGKFHSLVGEGKVLSFRPYLLVDLVLCWRQ